jgi:benzodiazapine receptor
MSTLRQVLGLILLVLVCFAVAGIGSSATIPSIADWYAGLRKPGWTPPAWLFGPVWTALYLSMAVAAWLVWRRVGLSGAAVPLAVFGLQLALNLAWSIIFFGRNNIGLALVDIVLLWLAIVATIFAFRHVSVLAGWLLVPYLIWVTFAAALNFSIWSMNR